MPLINKVRVSWGHMYDTVDAYGLRHGNVMAICDKEKKLNNISCNPT